MANTKAFVDVEDLKRQLAGRWEAFLSSCGVTGCFHLDERSCPHCHGKTRFRCKDAREGLFYCSHCGGVGSGGPLDGFQLVMNVKGWTFPEVLNRVPSFALDSLIITQALGLVNSRFVKSLPSNSNRATLRFELFPLLRDLLMPPKETVEKPAAVEKVAEELDPHVVRGGILTSMSLLNATYLKLSKEIKALDDYICKGTVPAGQAQEFAIALEMRVLGLSSLEVPVPVVAVS